MSEENNNGGGEPKPEAPKSFTQEQVNALLADQKRKLGEKFADYDALKGKADKFDQFEQDSKSELQKALDRASELEAKVAKFEQAEQVKGWAEEITKDSDIPATVLRGSTREELEQHFEQLKSLTPKQKRTSAPAGHATGERGSRSVAALRTLGFGNGE